MGTGRGGSVEDWIRLLGRLLSEFRDIAFCVVCLFVCLDSFGSAGGEDEFRDEYKMYSAE